MSNTLEHAKREFKIAGFNIDREIPSPFTSDDDYSDSIAKSVMKLIEAFSSDEHSGYSASATLSYFEKLSRHENLTPLTNNTEEWEDVGKYENIQEGIKFQSKRNYSCFSEDGLKTYYNLKDMEETKIDDEGYTYTAMNSDKKVLYPLEK